MNKTRQTLRCPLATAWSEQYARLPVQGLEVGAPYALLINGKPTPFQYTERAGEVLVRLGFECAEEKTLEFVPSNTLGVPEFLRFPLGRTTSRCSRRCCYHRSRRPGGAVGWRCTPRNCGNWASPISLTGMITVAG